MFDDVSIFASVADPAVNLALIALLTTCVGGLIWIIKYLFTEFKPVLDGLVKSTELNTVSTQASTNAAIDAAKASQQAAKVSMSAVKASQEAAAVSRHADEYLRQRNGRDNEMHTELLAGMKEIPNAMNIIVKQSVKSVETMLEAEKNLHEQHVDKQIVGTTKLAE